MSIVLLIMGLLLFVALVVVHEYGHYLAARRNGVEVEEFAIGFPPRAWKKRLKNKVLFTINWLPLGGFVKLKGEHDADTAKGSYGAATLWNKSKIMMAGVVMNLLVAVILFTVIAWIGMPKLLDNQFTVTRDTKIIREVKDKDVVKIDKVVSDSPAAKAGFKSDDRVVSVAGVAITNPDELAKITKAHAGETVVVVTSRNGQTNQYTVQLNKTSPYLGVSDYSGQNGIELRRSTWSAPIVAIGVTRDFTVATLKGLGTALKGLGSILAGLFTGNKVARQAGQEAATSQVSGPVGIFYVLYVLSQQGFIIVLFLIAIISLTLAIMNILPIPALDGGRLFVTLVFHAFKKPLTKSKEEAIHGTGFVALMFLILLVTIVDIKRFF